MATEQRPIRLGRALVEGEPAIVVGYDGGVSLLSGLLPSAPTSMLDLIEGWAEWKPQLEEALSSATAELDEADLAWLAPLMPPKLVCVGANYSAHNREMLGEVEADWPYLFLKPPSTTVIATGESVPLPSYAAKVDYEAELAAVMGPGGNIFGYTILNDVSVRDWVPATSVLGIDWVMSKCFDRSAPLGPWILPAEYVTDPQNLSVRLWVNDEARQDGNTSDMVFTVSQCIEHTRKVMTVEVGDVIATGTPSGVGMGDGRYLHEGDMIRIEIEGLGAQHSTIGASTR